jgi:hypothetical protein
MMAHIRGSKQLGEDFVHLGRWENLNRLTTAMCSSGDSGSSEAIAASSEATDASAAAGVT